MYEDDAFYKEADEHGILIWQDFIFACTTYPSDPAFLKRVEAEADYNIKRLRIMQVWPCGVEIMKSMKECAIGDGTRNIPTLPHGRYEQEIRQTVP